LIRNTLRRRCSTSSLELAAGITIGTPVFLKIDSVGSLAPEQ